MSGSIMFSGDPSVGKPFTASVIWKEKPESDQYELSVLPPGKIQFDLYRQKTTQQGEDYVVEFVARDGFSEPGDCIITIANALDVSERYEQKVCATPYVRPTVVVSIPKAEPVEKPAPAPEPDKPRAVSEESVPGPALVAQAEKLAKDQDSSGSVWTTVFMTALALCAVLVLGFIGYRMFMGNLEDSMIKNGQMVEQHPASKLKATAQPSPDEDYPPEQPAGDIAPQEESEPAPVPEPNSESEPPAVRLKPRAVPRANVAPTGGITINPGTLD